MPKRTRNYKGIDEAGYSLSDDMRQWIAAEFPDLDADGTFELFRDNCLANDRVYASWDAALRNWLRKSRDWGGVAYKAGMDGDPTWRELIKEARAIGFRMPRTPVESASQYRQAMRNHKPQTDLLGGVIDMTKVLKKVGR